MIPEVLIETAHKFGGGPEGYARALITHRAAQGADPGIAPAFHYYSGARVGIAIMPPTFTVEQFHEVVDDMLGPVRDGAVERVMLLADSPVAGEDCVVAMTWSPEGFSGRRWPYRVVDQTVTWGSEVLLGAAAGPTHDLIMGAFGGEAPLDVVMAALALRGYETEVLP